MNYREALEFIGEVRAGISWERFSIYAVHCSDVFIDMLNDTEAARSFLYSKGIDKGYVFENIKNILYRLHFNRENDHYLALALPHTATKSRIHKRWKDLMLLYHPDRNIGDEHAALCAKRINEAYSILKNPEKRGDYERMKQKAPGNHPGHPASPAKRRSERNRRSVAGEGLSLSPRTRKFLQRLVIPATAAVALFFLTVIFIDNKPPSSNPLPQGPTARSQRLIEEEVRGKETGAPGGLQDKERMIVKAEKPDLLSPSESPGRKGEKEKRGEGRFLENRFIQKIPLNPPLLKGEDMKERFSPLRVAGGDRTSLPAFGGAEGDQGRNDGQESLNREKTFVADTTASTMTQPSAPERVPADSLPSNESPERKGEGVTGNEDHKDLDREVFFFIAQYISAYENGDIERFMDCFSESAVENNSLRYRDIREGYKKNFEGNRYRYALRNIELREREDAVIVSGLYNITKLAGDDRGAETRGNITWTLSRENGEFRIVRVEYDKR